MKKITKNLFESLNKIDSGVDDVASYLYSCLDYGIELLPTYEQVIDEYSNDVSKSVYNKAYKLVLNLSELPKYDDMLELSNEPVLSSREFNDIGLEDYDAYNLYTQLVDDKVIDFKEKTGVDLHILGRSGRHVCVENNYENAKNYDMLKRIQSDLVDEVIKDYNNYSEGGE